MVCFTGSMWLAGFRHICLITFTMFARATVLGKIRTYLHLALKVRLSQSDPVTFWGKKLQVVVNDVARIVGRKRRSDHGRVEDLLKKAGLKQSTRWSNSAMLAWRASKPEKPSSQHFPKHGP